MMPPRPSPLTLARQRQDGSAPLVLLPGQVLLCSGQDAASRRATWAVIRRALLRCVTDYDLARCKLRGRQN